VQLDTFKFAIYIFTSSGLVMSVSLFKRLSMKDICLSVPSLIPEVLSFNSVL